MNAVRSIYRCAEHQDVDAAFVTASENLSYAFYERSVQDNAWIAQRALDQQTLPEPTSGES